MPDITMCTQDDCPMMGRCYRHEATLTTYRQSFSVFEPNSDGTCEWFMEIYPRKENEDG